MRNRILPITLLLAFYGCGDDDSMSPGDAGMTSMDGAVADASPSPDGATQSDTGPIDGGPIAEFCMGSGPLLVPTATRDRCSGQVAGDVFRFAVCSCGDLSLNGGLNTDSFNSATGAFTDAETGASVGTNGLLDAAGEADISGALYATAGVDNNGNVIVRTDLHTGGEFSVALQSSVARNAFIGGDISGELDVGGALTMPDGADEDEATYGSLVRAPVSVENPCVCDDEERPDVSGLVARYATMNDNELIDLSPDALAEGGMLDLPCGRYYLNGFSPNGAVTIRVSGRVALFIGGDVNLNGGFVVEMADNAAELDLFIDGDVSTNGALAFGDAMRPSASRIYITGDRIGLNGTAEIVGNLYAPDATLSTNGDVEGFGSLVVGDYAVNGDTVVHYDRSILDAGDECETPTECSGCGECGDLACVDGMCGACTQDSDCCSPLICFEGECTPLLI